jgi:hypothetical protein
VQVVVVVLRDQKVVLVPGLGSTDLLLGVANLRIFLTVFAFFVFVRTGGSAFVLKVVDVWRLDIFVVESLYFSGQARFV